MDSIKGVIRVIVIIVGIISLYLIPITIFKANGFTLSRLYIILLLFLLVIISDIYIEFNELENKLNDFSKYFNEKSIRSIERSISALAIKKNEFGKSITNITINPNTLMKIDELKNSSCNLDTILSNVVFIHDRYSLEEWAELNALVDERDKIIKMFYPT